MARGIGGSYGTDTGNASVRQVSPLGKSTGLASRLHYDSGLTADQVRTMPDEEWASVSGDPSADRAFVSQLLRAYEHYTTPSTPSNL